MTKKDFIFIAEVIRNLKDTESREGVAWAFVRALENQNARFDGERFYKAATFRETHGQSEDTNE